MAIYHKSREARRIVSKKHKEAAKNGFTNFKSLLAASNRRVRLCRNNKGAGLEGKQLENIRSSIQKVIISVKLGIMA